MIVWTHELDTWIVVAGVLSAVSCALLGTFLVLRRLSLMGDAISHAVLPGLAVGFLLTSSRESLPMFVGAAVVGVLTAVMTQWLVRRGQVEESASLGVVFTVLFALGLVLIERASNDRHVDLDAKCVLFGAIETVPLHLMEVGSLLVPTAVFWLALVLAVNVVFVAVFYKELKICSFDPMLAESQGIRAGVLHYALMSLVAVTTVAAFSSVGSILVIAMLVVPAAAAHLLTDRFGWTLILAVLLAAVAGVSGHVLAIGLPPLLFGGSESLAGIEDVSTSGMMALVAGGLLVLAMVFAPQRGLVPRLVDRFRVSVRVCREDLLALMYRLEERSLAAGAEADTGRLAVRVLRQSLGGSRLLTLAAIWSLGRRGMVERTPGSGRRLTDTGRQEAAGLVKSHRLWETYLSRHLGLADDRLHLAAEKLEHQTGGTLADRLDEELDRPATDPHGRIVPRPDPEPPPPNP